MIAPLSSIHTIPVTPETQQRLADLGVSPERVAQLTEGGALALLDLGDREMVDGPRCFGKFQRIPALCQACSFAYRCAQITPEGLDVSIPTPPPPPTPKAPADRPKGDLEARMFDLGYTAAQYRRARPTTRRKICDEGIRNEGVSISKGGELRIIDTPAAAPPVKKTRKRLPPPPPKKQAPPPPPGRPRRKA